MIYSSLNANSYPVVIAPQDFVTNSDIPTNSFYSTFCFESLIGLSKSELRTSILNRDFEKLSVDECIEGSDDNFLSNRRIVIAVTNDSQNKSVNFGGYGSVNRIPTIVPYTPDKAIAGQSSDITSLSLTPAIEDLGKLWIFSGSSSSGLYIQVYSDINPEDLINDGWSLLAQD